MSTIPAVKTPVTLEAMRDAMRAAWGGQPSFGALTLAISHSALECGYWKSCWNFNIGNSKAGDSWTGGVCFFECGEEFPIARARALAADPTRHVRIVREYTAKSGAPMASIVASPPDPICRFRAFTSLEAGVRDHLAMLRQNFPRSWSALQTGSVSAYAGQLAAEHYYTDSLEHYLAGLSAVVLEVRKKLSMPDTNVKPRFTFAHSPGENVGDRHARCWEEALADGPMGYRVRPEWYASFVNVTNPAGSIGGRPVDSIASWSTSCAVTQHASLAHSGRSTKPAVNGSGIYDYVGANEQHPAWQPNDGKAKPSRGDILYWASNGTNGHVECLLGIRSDGITWDTAGGGGGGDGTGCSLRVHLKGKDGYNRPLRGWWRVSMMGLPASPALPETLPELPPSEPANDILPADPQPPPARPDAAPEAPANPVDPMPPAPPNPYSKAPLLVLAALVLAAVLGAVSGMCGGPPAHDNDTPSTPAS